MFYKKNISLWKKWFIIKNNKDWKFFFKQLFFFTLTDNSMIVEGIKSALLSIAGLFTMAYYYFIRVILFTTL